MRHLPRHTDRFLPALLDASAPLILWAVFLFGVYAFAAVACDTALAQRDWGGHGAIKIVLLAVTMLSVAVTLALLWRAAHLYRQAPGSLMTFARFGIGLLGLIGILWTAVPMVLMQTCVA